jgi:hypothetical protein
MFGWRYSSGRKVSSPRQKITQPIRKYPLVIFLSFSLGPYKILPTKEVDSICGTKMEIEFLQMNLGLIVIRENTKKTSMQNDLEESTQ